MDKNVILTISSDERGEEDFKFATIKEATEFAEKVAPATGFRIFTLFMVGQVGKIDWKIAADHATNLHENTKAKEVEKAKTSRVGLPWTTREVETLINSRRAKTPIKQIAEGLSRTPMSCYAKLKEYKAAEAKKKKPNPLTS